ncbi:hypothetical protein ABN028_34625 [Actinopolymorpha sp. B17G11]|uniref:hypothetical protein n=1 Tax=Actinopolymorpha sp. B17G11 TaxID=3160861 RepID=UPI0032E3F28A
MRGDLDALESDFRHDFLREPDLGFAWAAYRLASGMSLTVVLDESGLAAGDFVRWVKQIIDLADQIADAAGEGPLRRTARASVDALRRGVVAFASVGPTPTERASRWVSAVGLGKRFGRPRTAYMTIFYGHEPSRDLPGGTGGRACVHRRRSTQWYHHPQPHPGKT